MAAQLLVLGFLADIQAAQRKTTSDVLVMLRRREFAPAPTTRTRVEPSDTVGLVTALRPCQSRRRRCTG